MFISSLGLYVPSSSQYLTINIHNFMQKIFFFAKNPLTERNRDGVAANSKRISYATEVLLNVE